MEKITFLSILEEGWFHYDQYYVAFRYYNCFVFTMSERVVISIFNVFCLHYSQNCVCFDMKSRLLLLMPKLFLILEVCCFYNMPKTAIISILEVCASITTKIAFLSILEVVCSYYCQNCVCFYIRRQLLLVYPKLDLLHY